MAQRRNLRNLPPTIHSDIARKPFVVWLTLFGCVVLSDFIILSYILDARINPFILRNKVNCKGRIEKPPCGVNQRYVRWQSQAVWVLAGTKDLAS